MSDKISKEWWVQDILLAHTQIEYQQYANSRSSKYFLKHRRWESRNKIKWANKDLRLQERDHKFRKQDLQMRTLQLNYESYNQDKPNWYSISKRMLVRSEFGWLREREREKIGERRRTQPGLDGMELRLVRLLELDKGTRNRPSVLMIWERRCPGCLDGQRCGLGLARQDEFMKGGEHRRRLPL